MVEERNAADDDHQQQRESHAEDDPQALAREELQLGEGEPPEGRTPFGKLSGGQKQRLSIALALLGSPQVAVLDELTTGLDPQARRDTWELIEGVRDRGVTIV
ncbi:MAG TPA: ATP-binding cassette domain-containing protein, partial [Streptosporangiaceae bacterium]|nr:ATP-binding cassette domain-containing protein [Streptosporangiaceae bacterium]